MSIRLHIRRFAGAVTRARLAQRPSVGEEQGWALITAIILMTMMLGMGIATYAWVDQEQAQSGIERTREAAFNFAEGTLTAQVFGLSRNWPGPGAGVAGSGITPMPTCAPASSDARCPSATTLASLFNSVDAAGGTWQTQIRDNDSTDHVGKTYYSDAITAGQPGYDANGDGRLWVRAQATARTKVRTLVALARVEEQQESLPRRTVLAGRLDISNNGNKAIIDTGIGTSQPAAVEVRCTIQLLDLNPCLGHTLQGVTNTLTKLTGLLDAQITPDLTATASTTTGLSAAALARLKATAIANGTYYASCPSSAPQGAVVWIDSGNCSYSSNTVVNSDAAPGIIIINNGTLSFAGTEVIHAVLYGVNAQNTSGTVISIGGNVEVKGAVMVDGPGTVVAGSSHVNIQFDPNALLGVKSYGSAGIIQNTWREIKG